MPGRFCGPVRARVRAGARAGSAEPAALPRALHGRHARSPRRRRSVSAPLLRGSLGVPHRNTPPLPAAVEDDTKSFGRRPSSSNRAPSHAPPWRRAIRSRPECPQPTPPTATSTGPPSGLPPFGEIHVKWTPKRKEDEPRVLGSQGVAVSRRNLDRGEGRGIEHRGQREPALGRPSRPILRNPEPSPGPSAARCGRR